ncbi:MAG: radical SAM/SPASM domain protein, ACGX system [Treponema sp. GWB1_62_6]|nr:MAG: radical SAM/SPASM domain protein, ACGX system [Treponema sp. GWA1_62_8]OHE68942.1 MAG: radical SAM/SPASM domain protein, ACGX system [Treponema sp. GWB1_62_6]OHE69163.1 MAG: radical SAM/SPASM domain protein, ACGX system [Treponema sp. GWC1_61_84]OHE75450.1 MAG: radical SAM/SPASM domain protein, ACGX system [Treponema sp. RIFOXYC1_FULL_61_9]HCM27798.1 radical SAM/SPASM domain protein, ACGX system [Treponema sp.]
MEYFSFQWHITDTCDQRCEHCYIFAEDHRARIVEMPLDQMRFVLDNCLRMCEKVGRLPYFYITGGDPILHRDFWTLLSLLKDREIPFTILGNPFHLNVAVCRRLAELGCDKYQLSIDGLRETHDSIRKPGSFDATLEKIPCIRDAGIKCAVMTTVSGKNIAELPDIVSLVVERDVDIFAFGRYCPTSAEKENHIAPRDYRALLETCWAKFEEHKDSGTTFNLKDHLWTLFLHEKGLFEIPDDAAEGAIYDGCNCGNCHLTILPAGDVYACRRMESRVGSVFSENLRDIFTGEAMDAYRQYDKFEKCSKCELLRFCRGCPAVARGTTGNMYAPDPQCWKEIGA